MLELKGGLKLGGGCMLEWTVRMALPMLPGGQLGKEGTAICAVKTYPFWRKTIFGIFVNIIMLKAAATESFKGEGQACPSY